MTRSATSAAEAAKLAELKQMLTSGSFETLEKLEEAVDAFLWADEDNDALIDAPFDPSSNPRQPR